MVFKSKHKICYLYLSWITKQFFNISITIFTCLITLMEMFFSQIYTLKTALLDKKLNRWTCTERCQITFKVLFFQGNCICCLCKAMKLNKWISKYTAFLSIIKLFFGHYQLCFRALDLQLPMLLHVIMF